MMTKSYLRTSILMHWVISCSINTHNFLSLEGIVLPKLMTISLLSLTPVIFDGVFQNVRHWLPHIVCRSVLRPSHSVVWIIPLLYVSNNSIDFVLLRVFCGPMGAWYPVCSVVSAFRASSCLALPVLPSCQTTRFTRWIQTVVGTQFLLSMTEFLVLSRSCSVLLRVAWA